MKQVNIGLQTYGLVEYVALFVAGCRLPDTYQTIYLSRWTDSHSEIGSVRKRVVIHCNIIETQACKTLIRLCQESCAEWMTRLCKKKHVSLQNLVTVTVLHIGEALGKPWGKISPTGGLEPTTLRFPRYS